MPESEADLQQVGVDQVKKQIDELKLQRGNVKRSITNLKNYVNGKADSLTANELQCRLEILESYWKLLLSHQNAIERLCPGDPAGVTARGELEDLYCEAKVKILSLMPNKSRCSFSEANGSIIVQSVNKANLPPLKLPQFTGKYSDFPNFMSTFNKLVHEDPDKSITEKYSHLRNCLSGAALQTIEALGRSSDNYAQALERLKQRYDNRHLMFQEHISEIFEAPKIVKGNASQLRKLVDGISSHLCALRLLGSDEDITNSLIIHIVMSKLDSESQAKWEEAVNYEKLPTWKDCESVLNRRCQFLESREHRSATSFLNSESRQRRNFSHSNRNPTSLKITTVSCSFCSDSDHSISKCTKFSSLLVNDRFEEAKRLSLCINCLSKGHTVKHCRSSKCRVCLRPHHTLLHKYPTDRPPSTSLTSPAGSSASNATTVVEGNSVVDQGQFSHSSTNSSLCSASGDSNHSCNHTFLGTAVIKIKDRSGCYHLARVLLDSGSQQNFITADLAHKLRLKRKVIYADISGIGNTSTKIRFETSTTIKSRLNNFESELHMWILPSITGSQPEREIKINDWKIPSNIELADPNFNKPYAVDLLIGADKFFELLCVGQLKLRKDLPTLQKTVFGWIVCGKYNSPISTISCNLAPVVDDFDPDDSLNSLVERFWEMESLESKVVALSEEEQRCEQLFCDTIKQTDEGRLMVTLPFKESPTVLGNSLEAAKKRFYSLERKLKNNHDLKIEYEKFLKEYLDQDHMEPVEPSNIPTICYYMPHHCVLRPESSSTKLRVVFDGSSRTSSSLSLNDILMVGPTVQNDLFSILVRFRSWKFALTADISKMFRQILVCEEHRNFQLILWRNDPNENLQTFRLKTVTYGTASAPFLATRCLNYLADKNVSKYSLGAKVIKNDFYVDDLLTGADTLEEITEIQKQVLTILQSASLELHKWYSNNPQLLRTIPESSREKLLKIDDSDIIRTLGIAWDPAKDEFKYSYKPASDHRTKVTKRLVLSEMSRLFDPLGLINPLVVKAKLFFQELWLLQLSWDESLPVQLHTQWLQFLADLQTVNELSIPRLVCSKGQDFTIDIHGFSDASLRAYGCCLYLRCEDLAGNISVHLLAAKSKVSPIKSTRTLPCLELCGAELLSNLLKKIQNSLRKPIRNTYLWTDSQIVLGWIKSHASLWKTFVSNRVSVIQELTVGCTWRYVPSNHNPADLISRGASVEEMKRSHWFIGPHFLHSPESSWPQNKMQREQLPEKRKLNNTILVSTVQQSFLDNVYRFSSFTKVRRVFAFVLRFINNARHQRIGKDRLTGELTASELQNSLRKLTWMIQQIEFADEIESLQSKDMISPKSCLTNLNPFLDNFMLLRVGGRLQNADLPYDAKSPILLPKNNPFVLTYVRYLHLEHLHAGPQALVAILRQNFWIINARDYCRKIVRECTHCFRYRPKLLKQIMGNLPPERLTGFFAFSTVGVDFCGPVMTTQRIRGKAACKSYIAVFICFLSKGVHLEVVSELTSDAFIATLKRFVSRRTLCRHLFCDNATNFVGARRLLKEFRESFLSQHVQKNIAEWCAERNIEFHHIPPRSPHFGGIWEAAVKMAKHHLYRTLHNSLLTYEELSTVCCQIEAILNSRPIAQMSTDPNDEGVLTPAHFWSQAPLDTILEPDLTNTKMSYVNRWRHISMLQQHFWHRWSKEYLLSLHKRHKWKFSSPNILVNQLVLVHDDNLPPQKWLLGKILQTFQGADGRVRVVEIKTKAGTLRRAIQRIALLPIHE